MKEIQYWINGEYYREKDKNQTIFQKCLEKKIDIPCFCYHEGLSIAGNCRMCLVEMNTSAKLVASCAMPLLNGMQIDTKGPRVKRARENVIEFLLINHPLDCPICDQAGECDLQEITRVFGSDKGRYYEYFKRAVVDKDGGTFIKMSMTRCIHCTRCVRFFNDIAGISPIGMVNRGDLSEISAFISKNLLDELSGNVIDLCPVGALTSRPYSYVARPWELQYMESIDVLDSVCSNVRIESLYNEVLRILPVYNKTMNEDWITNRVRFFYDSNDVQRITKPLLRTEIGTVNVIGWLTVFNFFFFNLTKYVDDNSSVVAFASMFSDLRSVDSMKYFFNSIGSEVYYADFIEVNSDFNENFLLNNLLVNLDNNLFFVFICLNSRLESPILNSRLRKLSSLNDNLKFYGFGINSSYLNLKINLYGNSIFQLLNVLKSKSNFNKDVLSRGYSYSVFNNHIKKNKFLFFFGVGFFRSCNGLFDSFKKWIDKNFYLNFAVVFPFPGYISFFEHNSGLNKFLFNRSNFIFLSGVDDLTFLNSLKGLNYFSVYKGSFFDEGAKISKMIIPSFTYFEQISHYYNVEGRLRQGLPVLSASRENIIGDMEFFYILRIVKDLYIDHGFTFSKKLKTIMKYFKFVTPDEDITLRYKDKYLYDFKYISKSHPLFVSDLTLNSTVLNYYKIDVYSRNSRILSSAAFDYLVKLNIFL